MRYLGVGVACVLLACSSEAPVDEEPETLHQGLESGNPDVTAADEARPTNGALLTADGLTMPQQGELQSEQDARAHDLAVVAKTAGWTLAEAAANRAAADEVARVAQELSAKRPGILVGSVLADDPMGPPTLFVKGPAEKLVRDLVADASVEIRVVDRQPFSVDELESRKDQVHGALQARGYREIATWYDIERRGQIHVAVTPQPGLPDRANDIVNILPQPLRAAVNAENVTVADGPPPTEHFYCGGLRNGHKYYSDSDRKWNITYEGATGWSVISTTDPSDQGVTIAGHSADNWDDWINGAECRAWSDPGTANGYYLHWIFYRSDKWHKGRWGDIAMYDYLDDGIWPDDTPLAMFYVTAKYIRWVTGIKHPDNMSVGEWVCIYSPRLRDDLCSQIWNKSYACGGVWRNVLMNSRFTDYGDSGASWYWNNTAYGSHNGQCPVSGTQYDRFSPAAYFPNAIGVRVKVR